LAATRAYNSNGSASKFWSAGKVESPLAAVTALIAEAATWSTPVVRLARGDRGNPREAALAATAPRPDGAGAVCQLQRRI